MKYYKLKIGDQTISIDENDLLKVLTSMSLEVTDSKEKRYYTAL